MLKRVKVVMLPTNEKAKENDIILLKKKQNISSIEEGKLAFCIFPDSNDLGNIWKTQHLYILSDEKIKEGDWCIMLDDFENVFSNPQQYTDPNTQHLNKGLRKIIATTDKLETSDEIFYDTFKQFLPQPSQSFIEKYVEEYNKGNVITEVLVEYEYSYKKNIDGEDIGFKVHEPSILKVNPKDNTITIRKMKDSWNREEVAVLLHKAIFYGIGLEEPRTENSSKSQQKRINKWIEENL